MKDNFIHVCFVIDKSGSMFDAQSDVIGGFQSIISEQKKVKDGQCSISLFTFDDVVNKVYIGKDINEIEDLVYSPSGCTALYDGVGTAIDRVGEWLSDMKEEDRPSKNLIVVMTDGYENASREYSLSRVKEMIEHQTNKYSWEFMYVGADITEAKDAVDIGIATRCFSSKKNMKMSYDVINDATTVYRCACADEADDSLKQYLTASTAAVTTSYEKEIGKKIDGNI